MGSYLTLEVSWELLMIKERGMECPSPWGTAVHTTLHMHSQNHRPYCARIALYCLVGYTEYTCRP
jgi:hypothetical protein